MNTSNARLVPWILLPLRLYLGVIFAYAAYPKLTGYADFPAQMDGFIRGMGLAHATQFYRDFLNGVVLPHVNTFAMLVTVGETAVAISLLTGTLTRLGSLVAVVLLTNYMFVKGLWWWIPSSNDGAQSIIAAVLAIGGAGRYFGVDAYLAKRWPKSALW